MKTTSQPVDKSRITLSFSYRNHLDETTDHAVHFMSIPDFVNYLRWEPEKAMLIGYGPVNEERVRNSRTQNTKISIAWRDELFKFETATQLGSFLDNTPLIARELQHKAT